MLQTCYPFVEADGFKVQGSEIYKDEIEEQKANKGTNSKAVGNVV